MEGALMLLGGRVALVTGAGRGLGRAHALALAAAGARVVINDLGGAASGEGADVAPAQAVAEEISQAGGVAVADGTDISNWAEAGRLIERTVERFGRLDVLVNNAGVCRRTAFGELSEADWDLTLAVNAKGPAALIDAAARHWRARGPQTGRAIVNTASSAGPHPLPPLSVYGVSKAAVLALTQTAAQELAPLGVRVNALAPIGRTRMVSQGADPSKSMPSDPDYDRFLPEHVATLVLYLASPLCPFTGRLFGVRGDDVVIFDEWDARTHVENAARAWTAEDLAAALGDLPLQNLRSSIGPKGRYTSPSPPDETLAALKRVAG
jgi:NAD(P)-dependent dehydrogenase (short-subunit alcohol dehydrogenase family)